MLANNKLLKPIKSANPQQDGGQQHAADPQQYPG